MEENTSLHTECAHKPSPGCVEPVSRTELLLGEDNMQRLFNARVARIRYRRCRRIHCRSTGSRGRWNTGSD